MSEPHLKVNKRTLKNPDFKRTSSSPKEEPSKKHQRKGENPIRVPPGTEVSGGIRSSDSWICKNSACRATLSVDDTFCKRCSCCICHSFDDNKDPSLWLECTSESGLEDSCGLSCHIECAFQHGKVGVLDLGQLMQSDGSYCCASCGKVSGILGCWRKQLSIAKDARRVDILCDRIFLSYRLLDGTSRFKDLHEFVKEAKAKLETEVGPLNGFSAKMARGIVSRLSVGADVQALCSLAIETVDEWLTSKSTTTLNFTEGFLPAACKFFFEEVSSSSVVVILMELSTASSDEIIGYKLWYCKTREETYSKEPVCAIPRSQRRVWISNLQPCTEYSFRIVSYSGVGDMGHSEAKCFTKSVELVHKNPNSIQKGGAVNFAAARQKQITETDIEWDSGFKVRDLGKILKLACAQEHGCFKGLGGLDNGAHLRTSAAKTETRQQDRRGSFSRELDLNIASVPDLNEEFTAAMDSSRDEDNECNVGRAVDPDDDVFSHELRRNGVARSNGSGHSHDWNPGKTGEVPAVESQTKICSKRKYSVYGDMQDSDSTLTNGSPLQASHRSGCLDENFEYCVKIIRWLECEGHIDQDFRLKLLTWFSLRSTEQEQRVVNTFIQTLIDDPCSLAGQLVDSFSDIISTKRPQNDLCGELWH